MTHNAEPITNQRTGDDNQGDVEQYVDQQTLRALAMSRMMTSGLRNRARNWSRAGVRFVPAGSFGP